MLCLRISKIQEGAKSICGMVGLVKNTCLLRQKRRKKRSQNHVVDCVIEDLVECFRIEGHVTKGETKYISKNSEGSTVE